MEGLVSLIDQVRDAHGGHRWDALTGFKGYVAIKGAAIARLQGSHELREVVAEGDIAAPSIRISGFAEATDWCVFPDFVAIRRSDGRFLGVRRSPNGGFPNSMDAADEIYLCSLGVWMCMTAPLTLQGAGARVEELDDWVEEGEHQLRLEVAAPAQGLTPAREATLYFDTARMLRRVDFASLANKKCSVSVYCSAFQSFAGFVLPTLYRTLRRPEGQEGMKQSSYLDVEIFDANYW